MYSSLSWKFHFFTAAFLCAAVRGLPTADPHINMTISVPAGTSNHGDPNLLCTPTKWLDVLVFFSANYFAHAATVKALPGETAMDFAFTVFLAIAFPFSGVSRGLEAIMRHASYSRNASNDNAKNDLQTAVRAGALCIVVRDIYWSCRPSDPSYPNYPNLPPKTSDAYPREQIMGERIEVDQESRTDPLLSVDRFRGKYKLEYVTSRKVHGLPQLSARLPKGYRLALLPSNTEVIPSYSPSGPKTLILSSTYSIPQVIIAIVQVLYASYSLYKTRGDQLSRYGYAAFGLTVIPYIIMSFLNLLGNLLTPNYPTLYLVDSPELMEAVSRGATIDGVVGMVSEVDWDASNYDRFLGHHANNIPECSRWKTVGESYQRPQRLWFLWWPFVVVFLGAIPYAVIGSLTHFRAAQSTKAQRILTMFWLTSGVYIGAAIPFWGFGFQEMKDILKAWAKARADDRADDRAEGWTKVRIFSKTRPQLFRYRSYDTNPEFLLKVRDRIKAKIRAGFVFAFLGSLVFGASAVGGFIVVGQMLRDYGSCTVLS